MKKLMFLTLLSTVISCSKPNSTGQAIDETKADYIQATANNFTTPTAKLDEYWYQGKAEITRYELMQNRYRDVHPGEAVMIFVTEDFLTDKQIKNDNYTNPNSIPILKNNMVRKFPTGIYDYSMMTSVFTPVNTQKNPATLKVTNSSQEWCGQTYMQINKNDEGYKMTLHSYFENEADQLETIQDAILEDELFNRIRINPGSLPIGKVKLVPSTTVLRLRHLPFQALDAVAELKDYSNNDFNGDELRVYQIEYPSLKRNLEIVFESKAPYKIMGWKDTYPSAFDRQPRTTIAKATKTIISKYWSENALADMPKRKDLGLEGID